MSVLIKNMSVPDNCNKCVFCVNGFTDAAPMYECAASGDDMTSVLVEDVDGQPLRIRPDWCPLIEIKTPHGNLIDADIPLEKVSKMMQEPDYQHEGENWMVGLIMARDAIDEADTIVEAERDE